MFGPDHLITLTGVAVASAMAFAVGGNPRWSNGINKVTGVLFALLAIVLWGLRLLDGFQPKEDLPLALCDIAFLLCVYSFYRGHETALILVAYWGLAGTLQAMVTPDLAYAFPAKEFFLFFVGHSVIVIAVFFLLGRHRPAGVATGRGVKVAFLGLLIYTAVVGSVDLLTGWNYGYLMAKPPTASVLDRMGPWPLYVGSGLGLALILFLAVAGLLKLLWNLFPGGSSQKSGKKRRP